MKILSWVVVLIDSLVLLGGCFHSAATMQVPEETFVAVLSDMNIAEAYLDSEKEGVKDSMTHIYYPQILKHYGVSKSDFDSTMSFLNKNPAKMENLQNKVVDHLQRSTRLDPRVVK